MTLTLKCKHCNMPITPCDHSTSCNTAKGCEGWMHMSLFKPNVSCTDTNRYWGSTFVAEPKDMLAARIFEAAR